MRAHLRAAATLAVLGATLGPVLDYIHVLTGAIRYPPPTRFVPWWVPLLYAGAAVAIGMSHPLMDGVIRRDGALHVSPSRVAAGFAVFAAVWVASGALPLSSLAVAAILAPASVALVVWLDRTWQGAVQALTTAIGGVLVEHTLIRAGLFAHTHQDFLGVALWLPWIYVAASVGVGNVGRILNRARALARTADQGWGRPGGDPHTPLKADQRWGRPPYPRSRLIRAPWRARRLRGRPRSTARPTRSDPATAP